MSGQFYKEPDIRRTNMKETGREDEKLQLKIFSSVAKIGGIGVTTLKELKKWKILKKDSSGKSNI